MKAITCSQCGAIIGDFSSSDEFTKCSYCNAKFRLRDVEVKDIPRKEVKRINARVIKYSADVLAVKQKNHAPEKLIWGSVVVFLLIIFSVVWINGYLNGSLYFRFDQPRLKTTITAKTQYSALDFNQQGSPILNFDKMEFPSVFRTELLKFRSEDLTKDIFSERTINVKVKVNKKGEVTQAKAQNGHEFLKMVCEEAAMKTTFFTPVNEDVTIIYMFSLID